MTALRPLTLDDFPEIYDKYLAADDPHSTRDDWRRMFTVSMQYGGCCGQGLFDAGRLVGMVGMLFSERLIQGQTHRFCNLHTWQVDEPHRGHSLLLLRPALALKEHTLTDFTATPAVAAINRRLGFQTLDSRLILLVPGWSPRHESMPNFFTDAIEIQQRVDDRQAAILRDHPSPPFVHLLAESEKHTCHLVAARVTRHWAPYCHIYHVSDPVVFRQFQSAICQRLRALTGTRFAGVDSRCFGEKLPNTFSVPLPTPQFYRASNGGPVDIDPLYSELAYLRLTTLPSKRSIARNLLNKGSLAWRTGRLQAADGLSPPRTFF